MLFRSTTPSSLRPASCLTYHRSRSGSTTSQMQEAPSTAFTLRQRVSEFPSTQSRSSLIPSPTTADPLSLIHSIHERKMKAGVAISPDTPSTAISEEVGEAADMLLVMTVYPGSYAKSSSYALLSLAASLGVKKCNAAKLTRWLRLYRSWRPEVFRALCSESR